METMKQVPDPEQIMVASNNLIVDQGIAIFGMVVFAIVIFGLLGIMFMIIRQMGRETRQQDKMLIQNGLTLARLEQNTHELAGVKDHQVTQTLLMQELIKINTEHNKRGADKTDILSAGIATVDANTKSIEDHTESVNGMKTQLEKIQKQLNELMTTTMKISEQDKQEIIDRVSGAFNEAISAMSELQKPETSAETEKISDLPLKAGVPVTPKPEEKKHVINLYKDKPKEEKK